MVVLVFSTCAHGMVFINEIYFNPKEVDEQNEFIELMGTPGMKLDGYAVAVLNGTSFKYYAEGSIPVGPIDAPEIDEFFSLDGLSLGANGTLSLISDDPDHPFRYPSLLSDSNWFIWVQDVAPLYDNPGIWNGNATDVPGKLSNSGSVTVILIRNRPGITEADPTNSAGSMWAKSIRHDVLLESHVWTGTAWMDKWGNGHIDTGDVDGMGGNSLDLIGLSNGDLSDDLEIVDEVSFEDDAGWEYDTDDRHVDEFSIDPAFPHRHVHALDNPIGFTPDAITRVDYRTTGDGWAGATGSVPEMSNGNNWQDMATEQWIRGNSSMSVAVPRRFFYDNDLNALNAVQPYETNVPLWLYDGSGADYIFGAAETYELMVGRTNPLAVPVILGDVDRDGDCDGADIAKISAVFGNADWIFSNSFEGSPEGSEVDPSTQTKPWDVDGTGDNGIEASDMQWVLNFQGDTTGQIVGIQYDSITPAATGVVLNSNAGVICKINTSVYIPSGRTNLTLFLGDIVEITVSGQLMVGANSTAGEENGIMQYVHDLEISSGGVLKVLSVEVLGSFNKTRDALQMPQGPNGELGVHLINGYSTSFTEGLICSNSFYKVTLQSIGIGSVIVDISSADALPASVVGFWKMDDNASNTTVVDSSVNGNNGTAQQNTDTLSTKGKIDGALNFNGSSDDYIDVGPVIDTSAYTKSAWIKLSAGDYYHNIISSNVASHAFWAPYSNSFKLSAGHNGTYNMVQDTASLAENVWYHVAVTFDPAANSGTMVLYKDGVQVDIATGVATQNASTSTYIGRFSTDYNFYGAMDNVAVFDRALSADEIGHLYSFGDAGARFAASAAEGVKIGHTDNNGDPVSSSYPALILFQSTANPADFNEDSCVDIVDFSRLYAAWFSVDGEGNWDEDCDISLPADNVIDHADLARFLEDWLAGCGL